MDAVKEQRLLNTVKKLETRVAQLEASEAAFIEELDTQRQLIREVNFRVMFAMRYFKFRKKVDTGVLDGNEKPVLRDEELTLWDVYVGAREKFIEGMETDAARQARENQPQSRSRTPPTGDRQKSNGSGDGSGGLKIH